MGVQRKIAKYREIGWIYTSIQRLQTTNIMVLLLLDANMLAGVLAEIYFGTQIGRHANMQMRNMRVIEN
jgi:hypothetical protein